MVLRRFFLDRKEVAEGVKVLSENLGKGIKDTWENNVSDEIKSSFSYEEIAAEIEKKDE